MGMIGHATCGPNVPATGSPAATSIAAACDWVDIHAFEPVPHTRGFLQRNLERNGLADSVTVWPCAVTDKAGMTLINSTPAEFDAEINRGLAQWQRVVADANIRTN